MVKNDQKTPIFTTIVVNLVIGEFLSAGAFVLGIVAHTRHDRGGVRDGRFCLSVECHSRFGEALNALRQGSAGLRRSRPDVA